MTTQFTYSIATNTLNGILSADKLDSEIRASAITVALAGIARDGDTLTVDFNADLPTTAPDDVTLLGSVVGAHDGVPPEEFAVTEQGNPVIALETRGPDEVPVVALTPALGKEVIYASHNYCDTQTWYSESTRLDDQMLTDTAGVWTSGIADWVCIGGGKILDEENVALDQTILDPADPHGYAVKVVVDGVEKTERQPHDTSGGDYTVDYAVGSVTPITESWTGQTVSCSFNLSNTSGWILQPLPGRMLKISKAELQFSKDIAMNDTIIMETFGIADYFAPDQLNTATPPGPLAPGTVIPIKTTVYKTIDQMVDEAISAFPEIPALSSATGRGFVQPRYVFQFHYGTSRVLFSSLGMYVKISLKKDTVFGGERSTATFYCGSKVDPGTTVGLAQLAAE